jgi:two-component system OmpR family sensor kinase
MNKITKKSFYSFLALYLISSFIFLFLAAYWFFSSQKAMEMQNNYYKMNKIADEVSADVINAAMYHKNFKLKTYDGYTVALFDDKKGLKDGQIIQDINFAKMYYMNGLTFTLTSHRTAGHLGIDSVVVQSNQCTSNVMKMKNRVIVTSIFVGIILIIISVILSSIFFRPIKEKILEVENFVKDTTHELNTPITALMMSTSRAKSKQTYDEKIIKNISISTKQLYDIYSSLSFLSFDNSAEKAIDLDFVEVVQESIKYFDELLDKKRIDLEFSSSTCRLYIAPTKAKMLINNLLSNAIKYSLPNTKIYLHVDKNTFVIKDEGIGIAKDKLDTIFQRFTRANSYAGGFGVGLNIVDSIVKEYRYKVDIASEENNGTTIEIKFS